MRRRLRTKNLKEGRRKRERPAPTSGWAGASIRSEAPDDGGIAVVVETSGGGFVDRNFELFVAVLREPVVQRDHADFGSVDGDVRAWLRVGPPREDDRQAG